MSALAAEVEAVEAKDMEVGLDYWLPGDVELQQMGVSLQKVAGLSGVLKVALGKKNSGKFGQNSGKQSTSQGF